MATEVTCAQRLDNAFNAAEKLHTRLVVGIASGKYEYFIESTEDGLVGVKYVDINYRSIPNIPPTSYLYEIKAIWVRTGEFKQEIERNWLSSNNNYFNYLKYKMAKHLDYILTNCDEGIKYYKTDKPNSQKLIHKLRRTGTLLNKSEVLLAMQLSFVELFSAFEDLIIRHYSGYTRLLTSETITPIAPPHDYIHLRYGERNRDVVAKLHTAFSGIFIDVDLNNFSAHFNPATELLPKLKWKYSQSLLCAIFSGVILPKGNVQVPKIEVSNIDLIKMLTEHFCYSNGTDLNPEILRGSINKLGQVAVRKIDIILPTLQEIEKSYKVL